MNDLRNGYLPYIAWLFAILFFAAQFIFRLWPGLVISETMMQLSISATQFGILGAFYYYGYSVMQIPMAILLDRFNPRYVISIFAILCGVGGVIFNYTENFYIALFARLLVGVASAAGFLGVSKIVSQFFPENQYARMIGFSFTFGLMGAVYGGLPVSILIEKYEWHDVALALSIAVMLLGVLIYIALGFIGKSVNTQQENGIEELKFREVKAIIISPAILLLALVNMLMVGALEGFADVWGSSYLMSTYSMGKKEAAGIVSLIFFGMLFGGPLLAIVAKRFGNYNVITLCGIGIALIFFLLLTYPDRFNNLFISISLFLIGVFSCYQLIIFVLGGEFVSLKYLGITVAFLNSANMLGGSLFHPLIGKLLDVFWSGALYPDGSRMYSVEVYKYALSIIPICSLIGVAINLAIKIRYPAKAQIKLKI